MNANSANYAHTSNKQVIILVIYCNSFCYDLTYNHRPGNDL